MKLFNRTKKETRLAIIGKHIQKYSIMMVIVLSVFILALIGLIIYWFFDDNDISPFIDDLYLYSQIAVAVITLLVIVVIVINKFKKIKVVLLSVICHGYAFVLMAWACAMCIIDLEIGLSPMMYLIVATFVSSLFLLEPLYFCFLSIASFVTIMVCHGVMHYSFFSGDYGVENTIDFVIYSVLVVVIAFRHFSVMIKEHQALTKVEQMTYYDELTSLLNERSYINKTEQINRKINNGTIKPFAVLLMDVNNLKATNDAYGHRYGCHLVVRTGHTLKEIFKTSELFHVGGDEFIAIIEGEDYENFDDVIALFDQKCRYNLIQHEGVELIFSVARGFAKYEDGNMFKDVLQKADEIMYVNKAEIKETYHLKKR